MSNEKNFNPNFTASDYHQGIVDRMIEVTEFSIGFRTPCNREKFIRHLLSSLSLSFEDKHKVWMAIPELSRFQVDSLSDVFEEEEHKFFELAMQDWGAVAKVWGDCWNNNQKLLASLSLDFSIEEEFCMLLDMIERKYKDKNTTKYRNMMMKNAPQGFKEWHLQKHTNSKKTSIPDFI